MGMDLLKTMKGNNLPEPGSGNEFRPALEDGTSSQISTGNEVRDPLQRSRLRENVVYGEVVEWKGNFGWINPAEEIQDESGRKYEKLFVLSTDVQEGLQLTEGVFVKCNVYKDSQGAGAENVSPGPM